MGQPILAGYGAVMQAQANGITIEYERTGSGEPLLMIMGLGAQLVSWPPGFIERLEAKGFDCIRFDNRDSGLSTHIGTPPPDQGAVLMARLSGGEPQVPYRVADMAADAASLLDALGIDSVHVVGVSMGGMITQALAIDHPAKVKTLTSIMSNTGSLDSGGIHPDLMARMGELTTSSRSEALETGIAMFAAISGSSFEEAEYRARGQRELARDWSPDGTARQTAAIMAGPDRTTALADVAVPALVIHGQEDPLVVPDGGEATAAALANAELVMHEAMGHNLPSPLWDDIASRIATLAGI